MTRVTITAAQIKELAEITDVFASSCGPDPETEYTLIFEPNRALEDRDGDQVNLYYYDLCFFESECPEEGCIGIGPPIKVETKSLKDLEA